MEIHLESFRDLLADRSKSNGITIQQNSDGEIAIAGVHVEEVESCEQCMQIIARGCATRATGATGVHEHSSRSHAIVSIALRQLRRAQPGDAAQQRAIITSKFNLVDLAGSERIKKTNAQGARLKEGININHGLLTLGKVISALADRATAPANTASHIPYRESKLTRFLQDSLGGNAQTVMIACVSPTDLDSEESLGTLRYATRARKIRNKPTQNVMLDDSAAQIRALQMQVAALQQQAERTAPLMEDGQTDERLTELQATLDSERAQHSAAEAEWLDWRGEAQGALANLQAAVKSTVEKEKIAAEEAKQTGERWAAKLELQSQAAAASEANLVQEAVVLKDRLAALQEEMHSQLAQIQAQLDEKAAAHDLTAQELQAKTEEQTALQTEHGKLQDAHVEALEKHKAAAAEAVEVLGDKQSEADVLRNELAQELGRRETAEQTVATVEEEKSAVIEETKTKLSELQDSTAKAKATQVRVQEANKELRQGLARLRGEHDEASKQYSAEKDELTAEKSKLQTRCKNLQQKLSTVRTQFEGQRAELEEKGTEVVEDGTLAEKVAEVEQLRTDKKGMQQKLSSLRSKLEEQKKTILGLQCAAEEHEAREVAEQTEIADSNSELQQKVSKLRSKVEEQRRKLEPTEKRLKHALESHAATMVEMDGLQVELDAEKARHLKSESSFKAWKAKAEAQISNIQSSVVVEAEMQATREAELSKVSTPSPGVRHGQEHIGTHRDM